MSLFQRRGIRSGEAGSSSQKRRRRALSRGVGLHLEALEDRLVLTSSGWTGAASGLWSNDGNWTTAPVANNDLAFPSVASNLSNTNDLSAGMTFNNLMVSGSGYAIGGSAVMLSGAIDASQTSGSSTVNLPITFSGAGAVTVDNAAASLVLGGVLSGSGGLKKDGTGLLDLTADNAYTGTTTVSAGVLQVDGAQGASPITVATGAQLQGIGTVGSITATGGTVRPGDGAPGLFTDTGDLTFQTGATYSVDLNGTTAGTSYGQTQVAGQVNLGGAALNVTLGFTPTGNESFTIINNTGNAAVSGTFATLAQGATVMVSGQPFQISYTGGDGNDVVLTHLVGSATSLSTSTTAAVIGQTVTLTATVASADVGTNTTPTGTVQFYAGSSLLGSSSLSGGVATLNTSTLPLGDSSITAKYLGDSTYDGSTSTASTVNVAQAATTASVTASPNPAGYSQPVTLTATITANSPGSGSPTGTVEFFNGATLLGSGILSGGIATLNVTTLPVGTNSITAQYQGSANYQGSTSSAVTETIHVENTTTLVSVVPNPSGVGQSVTLTATVGGVDSGTSSPTGTVQFFSGLTSLGTGTLSNGVATLSTSSLPLGSSSITAQYQGDGNFASSTSTAVAATVSQASSTTVTPSVSSIIFGQSVTLTAVVGAATGSGTPTGTVIFMSGTNTLGSATLSNGVAILTTPNLTAGTDSITAKYQGDSNFAGSTSPAATVTVTQASTTTTVTASPNPGGLNQLVTLTATVATTSTSSVKPSGTVQFFSGSVSLGTGTISNGVASLSTAALTLGGNSITAKYQGDTNYTGSTSPAFTETINQASATKVNVSTTTSIFGQPVTLTATVTASTGSGTPTGSVQFFTGTTSLGTATLTNGVATLSATGLVLGSNSVTAKYLGDSTFAGSTSTATTVAVTQASTTTALTISPNPSGFGQSVTLTATVTPVSPSTGAPTGTVTFMNGTTTVGTGTLSNGVATLTTTGLAFGSNSLTAVYAGDTNYTTSTSPAITATVNQSNSKVALTISNSTPSAYEAVTLTATVSGADSASTPTGTVVFFANGTAIGKATMANGVATLITTKLPLGTDSITAVYGGDSNFGGGTSSAVSATVGTDVEQFLNQVFVDAIGRPATLDELDFWRTRLILGVPVKRVVHQITSSSGAHAAVVQASYEKFLRRSATTSEIDAALSPASIDSGFGIASQLLGSREYYENQGAGNVLSWITAMYNDVIGTTDVPNSVILDFTQQISQGVSRTEVAQELLLSHKGRVAIINDLYQRVFSRNADPTGTTDLLGLMIGGGRINQALTALLSSQEFKSKFNIKG